MFDELPDYFRQKLIEPSDLEDKILALKKKQTIVSINGSFDLLHAGHLYILEEAKKQGDCLIVALNSDESIKRYKDITRPIIPLKYRLQMLSALQFVNHVTWFEEDDPRKILSFIKPHVHVNGAEYGESCLEAETVQKQGGRIHIVKLIDGLSTSQIIEKVRAICV
ncbi:MAG: Bifunctional protein HldE [Chlamydiae bacterium]|nr:Bifunctional protein HldE [Chlamydiota bacterium]